jgi:hypothetical protein
VCVRLRESEVAPLQRAEITSVHHPMLSSALMAANSDSRFASVSCFEPSYCLGCAGVECVCVRSCASVCVCVLVLHAGVRALCGRPCAVLPWAKHERMNARHARPVAAQSFKISAPYLEVMSYHSGQWAAEYTMGPRTGPLPASSAAEGACVCAGDEGCMHAGAACPLQQHVCCWY